MDGTEDENKHLYVKTPSIFQMIKSFTVEVSKYIAKGAPTVTQEDYVERLDACLKCENLNREKMTCGLCGCKLEYKAKMKTTTCPYTPSKWKKQELDGKEQKNNNTDSGN
tara:strand:+ start:426 stop:755 length:330 start_codon:yes stop_codon:yes gene_type:complete